ncbi:hypothetical protein [Foetidibacter luteolus]|uniref:hypothetical protein n=1 Tax=Foetidibacter luteolus TaxID=2608880 RepID=UPI00129A17F7|nr:hypothetical protein [Foetidibacter luteolus]
MKNILSLICVAAVMASCSSAYRTAQTPDDVYYSPAAPRAEARYADNRSTDDRYEEYMTTNDDQYLRMKVANRSRWNAIDDFDYWYDSRYDFGYGCAVSRSSMFYSFNPYFYRPMGYSLGWGYSPYVGYNWGYGGLGYSYAWGGGGWYAPCYTVVTYKNPRISTFRNTNYLNAYKNRTYSNANYNSYNNKRNSNFRNYDYNNNNRRTYRTYDNNNNRNSNYNNNNSTRSYSPSSSSGSRGSSAPAPSRSSGNPGRPPR